MKDIGTNWPYGIKEIWLIDRDFDVLVNPYKIHSITLEEIEKQSNKEEFIF